MLKFINEETGKEAFTLNDQDQVIIDGKPVQDMNEITEAVKAAKKEEEE